MKNSSSGAKNKVCFVIVYFGEFPIWFPAFLLSCKKNPSIDWMVWTDSDYTTIPCPSNVHFFELSLFDFLRKATKTMEADIQLQHPHKLCDFKPIYGDIFKEYLAPYDYWGHCDLDLVWGDIEAFLQKIAYKEYDIISTRRATICGHFTLYRNIEGINKFYSQVPNYQKVFLLPNYGGFDEGFFSYHLYEESLKATFPYKIFWPKKYSVDWPELDVKPYGWQWKNGKILDENGKERIYLHFMKWKKTLNRIDFDYGEEPSTFRITRAGIWSKRMNVLDTVQYLMPRHLGRWCTRYWYKAKGYMKHTLLKKPKQKELLIPEAYKKIG